MKKIFYALMFVAFVVLATSQIYMWKDQAFQWQIMQTQIKMLERILQWQNNTVPHSNTKL